MKDHFQFHGLGQCGSRIGLAFARLGYQVDFFNSDSVDTRGLKVKEEDLLLISGTGTGGSTNKGTEILEEYMDDFTEFLDDRMQGGKMQVFVCGLGGGTGGSSIIPAIQLAKDHCHKVGAIVTLPATMLGMLAMNNALKTLKQLKDMELNMFIVVDNELLMNTVGVSDEWWHDINEFIISKLVSVFCINREGKISQAGLGSIDQAEILRILQYGSGLTDVRDVYFNAKEVDKISDEDLKKSLFAPCFVKGFLYRNTLAYMVSIDMPEKGNYTDFSSRVFDITKKVCGSSISRLGMFTDPLLTNSIRVTLVNSGLKLPRILKSRMSNLKRDSIRHHDKKVKEDITDFSYMDDLEDLNEDFSL